MPTNIARDQSGTPGDVNIPSVYCEEREAVRLNTDGLGSFWPCRDAQIGSFPIFPVVSSGRRNTRRERRT